MVKQEFSHFHMEKWHITITTRIPPHANWPGISSSVSSYKGILYLNNLGGDQLKEPPCRSSFCKALWGTKERPPRRAARQDHSFLFSNGTQIQQQGYKSQKTYNTTTLLTITQRAKSRNK